MVYRSRDAHDHVLILRNASDVTQYELDPCCTATF